MTVEFERQQNYISELEAKLDFYVHLAAAMDDVKCGRLYDADEVFDGILADLESYEIKQGI